MIKLRKLFTAFVILLAIAFMNSSAKAQLVTFETNVGDIVVELFADDAPISVANFLGYVNRGDYDGTFFHRSVTDFVVQGGGFLTNTAPIPVQPPITNEFGRSNLRGTLAFARVGGIVDSATSQFFFNVQDNPGLDTVDEGFTVFGEVVEGLDIVDAINALQIVDANGGTPGPFGEIPLQDSFVAPDILTEDLVILNTVTITVPEPSSMILISGCSMMLLRRRRIR